MRTPTTYCPDRLRTLPPTTDRYESLVVQEPAASNSPALARHSSGPATDSTIMPGADRSQEVIHTPGCAGRGQGITGDQGHPCDVRSEAELTKDS